MIHMEDKTETEKAPKSRGIQDLAIGRSDVFRMDPRSLQVDPGWNSRSSDFSPDDEEDVALARSIAEVGVKEPITVYMRDGAPIVTNGHRRRAATLYAIEVLGAEIKSVPVQTEPRQSSEADRVLSQIVRNSGKPLQPIEKANVFAKLMDLGWDEVSIAKKVGVTRQYVVALLELRTAPRQVVAMVESGEVSATLARQTLRTAGVEAGTVLKAAVTKAKADGKSRATAKHVERKAKPVVEVLNVPKTHPTFVAGVRFAIEKFREGWADGEMPPGMAEVIGRIEAEIEV